MPTVFTHSSYSEKKIMSSLQQQFYPKIQAGLLCFGVYTLHNYMTHNNEEAHAPERMLSTLDSHKERQNSYHLTLAKAKDRADKFILTYRYLVHSTKKLIYWADAKAASCFLCLSTRARVSYVK